MANRQLSSDELKRLFAPLLAGVRKRIAHLSTGDDALSWALRRKLYKELSYDERGKPMHRRRLKAAKRASQNNKCDVCKKLLPAKNSVLDRKDAMKGYTSKNTRLLCPKCDATVQAKRGFK